MSYKKACKREETSFLTAVKFVQISSVPLDVNIISSHFINKIKLLDDRPLTITTRTTSYGNKE